MSMNAENPNPGADFTLVGRDAAGSASFEATGGDRRSVLEAALRAVLILAGVASPEHLDSGDVQSAPIRGEGDDLARLFSDLVDDLLDQADYFGAGLQDVTLDGLVRREDGGLVAWGYVVGTPVKGDRLIPMSLVGPPTVSELGPQQIAIRASVNRGNPSPPTPLPSSREGGA
jgi:hypothetical protein